MMRGRQSQGCRNDITDHVVEGTRHYQGEAISGLIAARNGRTRAEKVQFKC